MKTYPDLDPAFLPILEAMSAMPLVSSLPPAEARSLWANADMGEVDAVWEVRDLEIPGPEGAVPARLYRPQEPAGLMLYMHGGGWVLGDLAQHDPAVRTFANATGCAILSVNYRLAPEHPFPAPLEDAFASLCWMDEHRADLTGRDGLPLLIAGDSAGGNLAAALALLARKRSAPQIDGQILLYPTIDSRCATPSWDEHKDCNLLLAADMRWYWNQYVQDAADRSNPLATPCAAESLAGLPAAIVAVAGIDVLHDEGVAYAERLAEAGNDVVLMAYPSLPHGFFNFRPFSSVAAAAFDEIAENVRKLIGRAAPRQPGDAMQASNVER